MKTIMDEKRLSVFSSDMGEVRVKGEGKEALYCLRDVAKCLKYTNTRLAIIDHCKNVQKIDVPTPGGPQTMKFGKLSEVMRLIMHSRTDKALAFQDWVYEEVLPSIYNKGYYSVDGITPNAEMYGGLKVFFDAQNTAMKNALNVIEKIFGEMKTFSTRLDAVESALKLRHRDAANDTPRRNIIIRTYPSSVRWLSRILADQGMSFTCAPVDGGGWFEFHVKDVTSSQRFDIEDRINAQKANWRKFITIKLEPMS